MTDNRELLAEALYATEYDGITKTLDVLLPVVEAIARGRAEQAWDEGWAARKLWDETDCMRPYNPYAEEPA